MCVCVCVCVCVYFPLVVGLLMMNVSIPHCLQIGTGFKDEELEQHTEFFKNHLLEGPKPYYRYNEGTQPDQWFDSVQVNWNTLGWLCV